MCQIQCVILYKHLYLSVVWLALNLCVDTKRTHVEKRLDYVLGGLFLGNLNDVRELL